MNLFTLSAKNALRNRTRTTLTVVAVAVATLTFVLLRTTLWAWNASSQEAAQDRLATRSKVSLLMTLPMRYAEDVKRVPGVEAVNYSLIFGGRDARNPKEIFSSAAVDHLTFLDVFTEIDVPPDQVERWRQDRQGALVGDVLAKKLGWTVGTKVVLEGGMYPGEWEFHVSGIYTTRRRSVDRSTFFLRWDYVDGAQPAEMQGRIGWISTRIDDPARSGEVARAIDAYFASQDEQTLTMSEKAMQRSFLGTISAVLRALDLVALVILVIMLLILGNTIAMGVRERNHEYGVLRAIGFLPRHIAAYVIGEGVIIGIAGGLLGLALSYPIVQGALGRWLEENFGAIFPYFRVQPETAALATVAAALAGAVAALVPAWRAQRLQAADALRRR